MDGAPPLHRWCITDYLQVLHHENVNTAGRGPRPQAGPNLLSPTYLIFFVFTP